MAPAIANAVYDAVESVSKTCPSRRKKCSPRYSKGDPRAQGQREPERRLKMSVSGHLLPFPDPGAADLMSDHLEQEVHAAGPGKIRSRVSLPDPL